MMKRLVITVMILTLTAATAYAQPGPNGDRPGQRAGAERMGRMQEDLGLSEAQAEQIRQIRENGGSREEIHAVLTEEQRELVKDRRSQGRGQMGRGGGRGKGSASGRGRRGTGPGDG